MFQFLDSVINLLKQIECINTSERKEYHHLSYWKLENVPAAQLEIDWMYAFRLVYGGRTFFTIGNGGDYYSRGKGFRSGHKKMGIVDKTMKFTHKIKAIIHDTPWANGIYLSLNKKKICIPIELNPPSDEQLALQSLNLDITACQFDTNFKNVDGKLLAKLEIWLRTNSFVCGTVCGDDDKIISNAIVESSLSFPPVQFPFINRWLKSTLLQV